MKLEWLEDLLAVIDQGSLSKAAVARHLTQPAFSRRVRAIESYLGCELFDRNRKPLQLTQAVLDLEPAMRDCVSRLRELSQDLERSAYAEPLLIVACQHSISTAVAPVMITQLAETVDARIRLRSANRDECLTMVLTGQAGVAVVYQLTDGESIASSKLIESINVGQDELIPVICAQSSARYKREKRNRKLSVIAYPEDVYLGKVFRQKILPSLTPNFQVQWKAETGLTTAAAEFARAGAGVAWVPRSLVTSQLNDRSLFVADKNLPRVLLNISLLTLKQSSTAEVAAAKAWLISKRLPLQ
jgi:DNA-binding transcriptional LysR family regulator